MKTVYYYIVGAILAIFLLVLAATQCDIHPRNANERTWNDNPVFFTKIPVSVGWDTREFGAWNESLEWAVSSFNSDVGCTILVRADNPIIKFTIDGLGCGSFNGIPDAGGNTQYAETWRCPDGTISIPMRMMGSIVNAGIIAKHELGEAFSLMHDDYGIMFGGDLSTFDTMGVESHLSSKDIAALRSKYCSVAH